MSNTKGPIVFSRRRFYVLISSLIILIILVPAVVYWSDQRIAEHTRWDSELHFAYLFDDNVDIAADSINGTFYPWSNQSQMSAINALSQAGIALSYLEFLDWSHVNQLDTITNNVHGVPSEFSQITQSHRVSLSASLRSLGVEIVHAYFLNNTSTSNGVGPSFWYFGPSPPNEQDLQEATTIAATLTG